MLSADFWAGYISGAAGIIIGNPLDLLKVRLQAAPLATTPIPSLSAPTSYRTQFPTPGSLIRGATAPVLGYGALNALLFMTYNRTVTLLTPTYAAGIPIIPQQPQPTLTTIWLAGAIGGLATWIVSAPTELIKCRAQLSAEPSAASPTSPSSSWGIARDILRTEGPRGLYFGGTVTALRDSVGYGFYFWSYELCTRLLASKEDGPPTTTTTSAGGEAAKVLLCGGIAGVATWASIFPLDVVKTRVQTQFVGGGAETAPLLGGAAIHAGDSRRLGAMEMARLTYRNEGVGVFFRGLTVCSVRAFVVNAAQWAVYEWIMKALRPEDKVSV